MGVITGPFRGSEAVQDGLVTRGELFGPNYLRLFPDIYLPKAGTLSLSIRSMAAYLLVELYGVLVGYSAAELLGASCAPRDADAEVGVPGRSLRDQPGLRVHRDRLADDEITEVMGMLVTTPKRTAYDLARWLQLHEAVVAVDALARIGRFQPSEILSIRERYPRARWRCRVPGVVGLADRGAESVMETRCRLVLIQRGLPRPTTQYRVRDATGRIVARLDMAYPGRRVGVEFDGRPHRDGAQAARDQRRDNALAAMGWVVLRFGTDDVLRRPDELAQRVRDTLAVRRTAGFRAQSVA
ncbi:MAG TPA: DUF559 domain-containing protein [Pseudonocardiaceae bacterium]|jgi:very-short-patch-repair endonuclease